jgi:hypothetical protein
MAAFARKIRQASGIVSGKCHPTTTWCLPRLAGAIGA